MSIQKEILDLEVTNNETPVKFGNLEDLTVLRMDFKARIKETDGKESLIIIELQKAKLPTDIMRFRKYLGQQYSDKDNSQILILCFLIATRVLIVLMFYLFFHIHPIFEDQYHLFYVCIYLQNFLLFMS